MVNVKIDIASAINESVSEGLNKAGLPDTPHNRVEVLNAMHDKLVEEEPSTHFIRHVLIAIEDEVIRLDDIICPRCGGDHDWCQDVRPDEY